MANRKIRQTRVPDGESANARFRRVLDTRLRPLLKQYDRITGMVKQPSYAPSESDLKIVIATITETHNAFVDKWTKALNGTTDKKDKKEFSGIDWNMDIPEEPETPY